MARLVGVPGALQGRSLGATILAVSFAMLLGLGALLWTTGSLGQRRAGQLLYAAGAAPTTSNTSQALAALAARVDELGAAQVWLSVSHRCAVQRTICLRAWSVRLPG